jgi:hypothetical protein
LAAALAAAPGLAMAAQDPAEAGRALVAATQILAPPGPSQPGVSGEIAFRAGAQGEVTHIQSGMICLPGSNSVRLAGLTLYLSGGAAGDDVSCGYAVPGGALTLYATRTADSAEQTMAGTIEILRAAFPDSEPTTLPRVAAGPGLTTPLVATLAIQGGTTITSAWVARQGDWIVKVRATYPASMRDDAELTAGVMELLGQRTVQAASSGRAPPARPPA